MPSPNRARILVVDDQAAILEDLQRQLQAQLDVTVAAEAKEALKLVVTQGPHAVVVSDLRMPGMDGVTPLYSVRTLGPNTVRVPLTGHEDLEA